MSKKHRTLWLIAGIVLVVTLGIISISKYQTAILKSREAVLRVNLDAMRKAINRYAKDKQRAPQTLQDLVQAGYFRELPIDPMTNSNSSWKPVVSTLDVSSAETGRGITDVRSGSSSISRDGTSYSGWYRPV
jgi:general secretion pathway protein G